MFVKPAGLGRRVCLGVDERVELNRQADSPQGVLVIKTSHVLVIKASGYNGLSSEKPYKEHGYLQNV